MNRSLEDKNSIFYTYQKLVELHGQHSMMVWGDFKLIEDTVDEVFAYYRFLENTRWLIVANISNQEKTFQLSDKIDEVLIHNYSSTLKNTGEVILKPMKHSQ